MFADVPENNCGFLFPKLPSKPHIVCYSRSIYTLSFVYLLRVQRRMKGVFNKEMELLFRYLLNIHIQVIESPDKPVESN